MCLLVSLSMSNKTINWPFVLDFQWSIIRGPWVTHPIKFHSIYLDKRINRHFHIDNCTWLRGEHVWMNMPFYIWGLDFVCHIRQHPFMYCVFDGGCKQKLIILLQHAIHPIHDGIVNLEHSSQATWVATWIATYAINHDLTFVGFFWPLHFNSMHWLCHCQQSLVAMLDHSMSFSHQ